MSFRRKDNNHLERVCQQADKGPLEGMDHTITRLRNVVPDDFGGMVVSRDCRHGNEVSSRKTI